MTAIVGWTNYVKSATITANNAAPGLPVTNIATDQGSASAGWQTAAGVLTLAAGALFRVTPPTTGQTWRVVSIHGTNLTSAATVTLTLWNNVASPVVVTSTALPGPVAGYGQVVWVLPANTTADFLQVYFDDPTNPDGFLNIPLMFAGPAWIPAGSTGFDSAVGRDESVAEVVTRGGQEYPSLLWQRRRWDVTFDSLRQAETWTQADPLFRTSKAGSNIFFCPDSASPYLQQEAIFGRLKGVADFTYPYQGADRRRWQASITERL